MLYDKICFYKFLYKIQGFRKQRLVNHILISHSGLRQAIEEADNLSRATGSDISDYVVLYAIIKKLRPRFILECGTGKSTFVLAQAMKECWADSDENDVKIVSMENNIEWFEHASSVFPSKHKNIVEIRFSPIEIYGFSIIQGTVYKEIPEYPYDLVYVDGGGGPFLGQPVMCSMDLIKVVTNSQNPVTAIIDTRIPSAIAYGILFGRDKVRYFPAWELGIVTNVTKEDLIHIKPGSWWEAQTEQKGFLSRYGVRASYRNVI